jgi:hypothetical protein
MPKLYNEKQLRLQVSLETAVRRVGVSCEMPASLGGGSLSNAWVVRKSPARKDVDTEDEETTTLEAVTRRQPVKLQETEKI